MRRQPPPLFASTSFAAALIASAVCLTSVITHQAAAADWPAWRAGAMRTGATAEQLPAGLQLQWKRKLPPLSPAWAEDQRLQFDTTYQPVVAGKQLLIASAVEDCVSSYDTTTGAFRWRFFADGPVRFAPAVENGKVYFGADDGRLYCLNLETGKLLWKFDGAPSDRRILGNDRLISVWPVRGGPVLNNGKVYFTVGVWPFEGTLLYELDATTGKPFENRLPVNLKELSPQGYLVASGSRIYVPCGRANAACFDMNTRKQIRLSYNSKGTTGWRVTADGQYLFHGGKIFNAETGKLESVTATQPVATGGMVYFADKGAARAIDLKNRTGRKSADRRGKPITIQTPTARWKLDGVAVTRIHLKAGNQLYAHHGSKVLAINLPAGGGAPSAGWSTTVEGTPGAMAVADGKLFVVTKEGGIHCYGQQQRSALTLSKSPVGNATPQADAASRAKAVVAQANDPKGYAVIFGSDTVGLVDELIKQSELYLVVVQKDAAKVNALRQRLYAAGNNGSRVSVFAGELSTFKLPPYLATVAVIDDANALTQDNLKTTAKQIFHILRPYGGTACATASAATHAALNDVVRSLALPKAVTKRAGGLSLMIREGALPGSADWTHEYGDTANTLMSRDKLVKAPLGLLWFGGPSSKGENYYDRHDWGPSLAVVEGRMFIQGPQKLTAIDVYTGRVLWQNKITGGVSPGRRANWKPTGFHFVAQTDGLYLAFPDKCVRIDPSTGKQLGEFKLEDKAATWGRIRIKGDKIIVPVFRKREGSKPAPDKLVALDRFTGKQLWEKESATAFPLVAIGSNKVICYEGFLDGLYVGASKRRKGGVPVANEVRSVRAFDIDTGKEVWSRSTPRAASWLAFSERYNAVVISNKTGIDVWDGKEGESLWSKTASGVGFRGHPENYWDKVILMNDQIIDQRGPGKSYNVRTGAPVLHLNPLTGAKTPWEFTKIGHHCNYAIANEHLMTFRAASAGFCDLSTGGTGRLEGFRSGCRNSLIPANGVLNAPNFAHGCICSYSIFTSLALVHVPRSDMWTYSAFEAGDEPVTRAGINLGAPGDRTAEDGTLWLDYPSVGGPSPKVAVKLTASSPEYFRLHPEQVASPEDSSVVRWVAASGVEGVETLTIDLNADKKTPQASTYTVKLHFLEPRLKAGERVFSVKVQSAAAITGLDIAKQAGGIRTPVVHTVDDVKANGLLTISFEASKGVPVISGVEVIAGE